MRVTNGEQVVIVKVTSRGEGAREGLSASVASVVSGRLVWESLFVVEAVAITVTVTVGETVAVGVGLGSSGIGSGSRHLVTVSVDDRHDG